MKKLISSLNSSYVVTLNQVSHKAILGLEAGGQKYILSPVFNCDDKKFGFVNGNARWCSGNNVNEILEHCLREGREVLVFEDTEDFKKWFN